MINTRMLKFQRAGFFCPTRRPTHEPRVGPWVVKQKLTYNMFTSYI